METTEIIIWMQIQINLTLISSIMTLVQCHKVDQISERLWQPIKAANKLFSFDPNFIFRLRTIKPSYQQKISARNSEKSEERHQNH